MKTLLKWLITGFVAVALTGGAASAQDRRAFSQQELDQMLAPIALYPDALLSQILMAATYPVEVVQAARWSRANTHLTGEDAVRAVEPMDWDPSVKSLAAFPQILNRMDEKLDWTERLGEAFIAQELQVMDTIQHLRRRAAAAGHLGPDEHLRVMRQGDYISIEPADPQVIYVPYYDPVVVYGSWWWPAYPPVHWAPWPGYYVRHGYPPTYYWGSGIVIRIGFFFGHFDWPRRHVTVVHRHPPKVIVHEERRVMRRPPVAPEPKPVRWQHDQRHRRDAPYRHIGPRNSRPTQPAPSRGERRPDGSSGSPRPQSQSAPQPPARAVPAAPRSDAHPGGAAPDRRDRQARRAVPVMAAATRGAGDRGNTERPARSARENARATQPPVMKDRVTPRTEARRAGAALADHDRELRRPAAAPPAAAARGTGDRGNAQRPAATARENIPFARPAAMNGSVRSRDESTPGTQSPGVADVAGGLDTTRTNLSGAQTRHQTRKAEDRR